MLFINIIYHDVEIQSRAKQPVQKTQTLRSITSDMVKEKYGKDTPEIRARLKAAGFIVND